MFNYITVEPLIVASTVIIFFYTLVSNQFVFHTIAKEHNLTISNHSACSNVSDPAYNAVSAESSMVLFYISISGDILCNISLNY